MPAAQQPGLINLLQQPRWGQLPDASEIKFSISVGAPLGLRAMLPAQAQLQPQVTFHVKFGRRAGVSATLPVGPRAASTAAYAAEEPTLRQAVVQVRGGGGCGASHQARLLLPACPKHACRYSGHVFNHGIWPCMVSWETGGAQTVMHAH